MDTVGPTQSAERPLVSIVIPCYNPREWLREAVASARAQTHPNIEIIVVDDGSQAPGSKEILRSLAPEVTRIITQPNRGVSAARNTGFRAAAGDYVVPLDSDDRLAPDFVCECLSALNTRPAAAFAYTDYRVFGRAHYVETVGPYNLFRLLSENTLGYAGLLRKRAWEEAGGYDESMPGYEDWELWLRLGARGYFGHYVNRVLHYYRKHGRSLLDAARERHDELVARIHAGHPELYSPEAYAAIKACWEPAVCIVAPRAPGVQTITDFEVASPGDVRRVMETSKASVFLLPREGSVQSNSAELAALAVWSGHECVELPDGSLAASRDALSQHISTDQVRARRGTRIASRTAVRSQFAGGPLDMMFRHLANAGLLSWEAWRQRPLQSLTRMIPLRLKEQVNQLAGRSVFDLSFYLQFQPRAVLLNGSPVSPVEYLPAASTRRRIALVTPHLGAGGAESVLLEVATACDRSRYEISVIATHPGDNRWMPRWRACADHIYDLGALVPPERVAAALYCIAVNWRFDYVLIQNSLPAYSMVAELKKALPAARLINLIHASSEDGWDLVSTTAAAVPYFDAQVAVSETVRRRLLESGVPKHQVHLIPNGVDLERFRAAPLRTEKPARILFAARLDAVKRPLLLADIAVALARRRNSRDFVFVVAGDGPEREPLAARVKKLGVRDAFEFLGHVEDMAPLFAASDLLVLTSANEGVPLVVLEAMASARPVVASDAGAIHEVLGERTGVLVPRAPDEVERFAEAIDNLLNVSDERACLGRRARLHVESTFDRRRALAAYRELFA
jgi:glycosyltransferase involved in cell wall biosynthesis/GT2 family glycosyltransferase